MFFVQVSCRVKRSTDCVEGVFSSPPGIPRSPIVSLYLTEELGANACGFVMKSVMSSADNNTCATKESDQFLLIMTSLNITNENLKDYLGCTSSESATICICLERMCNNDIMNMVAPEVDITISGKRRYSFMDMKNVFAKSNNRKVLNPDLTNANNTDRIISKQCYTQIFQSKKAISRNVAFHRLKDTSTLDDPYLNPSRASIAPTVVGRNGMLNKAGSIICIILFLLLPIFQYVIIKLITSKRYGHDPSASLLMPPPPSFRMRLLPKNILHASKSNPTLSTIQADDSNTTITSETRTSQSFFLNVAMTDETKKEQTMKGEQKKAKSKEQARDELRKKEEIQKKTEGKKCDKKEKTDDLKRQ